MEAKMSDRWTVETEGERARIMPVSDGSYSVHLVTRLGERAAGWECLGLTSEPMAHAAAEALIRSYLASGD
jgi:hypothetical protein